MAELEQRILMHPAWAHAHQEELEGVAEGVEKLVCVKLFPLLFASTMLDRSQLEIPHALPHSLDSELGTPYLNVATREC